MNMLIKTLTVRNAELFVTYAGKRKRLADVSGQVEIYEKQTIGRLLGQPDTCEKKVYALFVLDDGDDCTTHDDFSSVKVYDAVGDVYNIQGYERVIFSGLRFEDNDPVKGTVTLSIPDLYLIQNFLTVWG